MLRYTVQLFGITIFAMALIWFAGPGEAVQSSDQVEPVLWADTVHINLDGDNELDGLPLENRPEMDRRDTFMKNVKKLTQTAFNIRNQYM